MIMIMITMRRNVIGPSPLLTSKGLALDKEKYVNLISRSQCVFGSKGSSKLANIKNTIHVILFVFPSKILHRHCFYFLLGLLMVPNWKECLCKILEGKSKSIMVF